jgi:hypothetical protein
VRGFDFNDPWRALAQNWIVGFFTGYSFGRREDLLRDSSADAIFQAIDERCKLKPEEPISEAVNAVADKLK